MSTPTTTKLATAMVHSVHYYPLQLANDVRVGDIAGYLSQYESHLAASTLERARRIDDGQHLQDIDIRGGDRLLIFTNSSKHAAIPASLKPGDKVLRFSLGEFAIESRGKTGVLIGKSDDNEAKLPDVDLRYFIPEGGLEHISRGCVWLSYDEQAKQWFASKLGHTRVMIDEFELGPDRVPLNDNQWIRFYRADYIGKSLGGLHFTIETVKAGDDIITLPLGDHRLNVHVGAEDETHLLRASGSMRVDEIATHLARYLKNPLSPASQLYVVRLISPDTRINRLELDSKEFLYAARTPRYVHTILRLRDVHEPEYVFSVSAGMEDDEKIIGCRMQKDIAEPALDIDLHDLFLERDYDPTHIIANQQGKVCYKASENTWWLLIHEQALTPMFINSVRVTSNTATQLISGDVLSIGPNTNQYYARLTVEITTA